VFRGILLAANSSPDEPEFWRQFGEAGHPLRGLTIYDPFMGGGTTLIEGARLGARVFGADVDPLAADIVRNSLGEAETKSIHEASDQLLEALRSMESLYLRGDGWTPLHYFYLFNVKCPACNKRNLLYRSTVLARDARRHGGVRREHGVVVFCPKCRSVHGLRSPNRKRFSCCGISHSLVNGTYRAGMYACPECGNESSHSVLKTATAERVLIGVEETSAGQRRRIRAADDGDHSAIRRATRHLAKDVDELYLPKIQLEAHRHDPRPRSYGITESLQFFTPRQKLFFGRAFHWLNNADLQPDTAAALRLAISNTLTTNNILCSYATDYGRLAPLFSVRSYSLPALSVELNPLHPSAGRGTLRSNLRKVARSRRRQVRRHSWDDREQCAVRVDMTFRQPPEEPTIVCGSAADVAIPTPIDLCVFDPPYFDYIAYSELSEFYRCWSTHGALNGAPLFPSSSEEFGDDFGRCLIGSLRRLKPLGIVAFTFHSTNSKAWAAVGRALDQAGLSVTALWPVWNDAHMGHHSSAGNCEWDVLVVCRHSTNCRVIKTTVTVESWLRALLPLSVSAADRRGMEEAIAMASQRFAEPGALEGGR
jgi:putative DNA methylase